MNIGEKSRKRIKSAEKIQTFRRKGANALDYHMLNTHVAKQCGVNASLILVNLKFWIEKNRANEKHFHDGYYWTYCSAEAMCKVFDYLSPKQIRAAITKLIDSGYIIKGNYNKSAYDRTLWYAITDKGYALFGANGSDNEGKSICPNGQMEMTTRENRNDREGTPIPDIITDVVPDVFPPNPPKGGTGDKTPASVSDKPPQKKREPPLSPELTPKETSALLAFSPRLCDAVQDWFLYKAEKRQAYKPTGRRNFITTVLENAGKYGVDAVVTVIRNSMSNGYMGVTWAKLPEIARGGGNGARDRPSWEEIAENVAKGINT